MNSEHEQIILNDNQFEPVPKKLKRPRSLGDGLDDHTTLDNTILDDDAGSLDEYFNDLEESRLPAPLNHAEIEATLAAKKSNPTDPFAIVDFDESQRKKVIHRRPTVDSDENRLLDPKTGIPKLLKMTAGFKTSGKGKEKEDLSRLLKVYRLWTHSLLPNENFSDAIETVGKLCRKKKLKRALKKWRLESLESTSEKSKHSAQATDPSAPSNSDTLVTTVDSHRDVKFVPSTLDLSNPEPAESSSARSPLQSTLFRPEDGSEDEFPIEHDIDLILNSITT